MADEFDEEGAKALLQPILGVEEDLLDYIVGAISEDIQASGESVESLYEVIGELLLGYELAEDETAAMSMCEIILTNLGGAGLLGDAPTEDDSTTLLKAPVVIAENLITIENPLTDELEAVKLGQKLLSNEGAKVFADAEVKVGMTKAKTRLINKEKQRITDSKTWTENPYEHLKQEAIETYLQNRNSAFTKDVLISEYTMNKPGTIEPLLENTALRLICGHRYGLCGRNGVGKSTLLREVSGYKVPNFPTHLKVLHVEQEVAGGEATVLDAVIKSDLEREALLEKEAILKARMNGNGPDTNELTSKEMQSLTELSERLDEMKSFSAEGRAKSILKGLQFDEVMMHKRTMELSGGWRMRVALASALFVEPDILLLDEPTNHLDFLAVKWLQDYLKEYPKTMIVVSHDRSFLDEVVTDMIHLSQKKT